MIENVSESFRAKRGIPIEQIVQWLEQHIVGSTRQLAMEVRRDFPTVTTDFNIHRERENSGSINKDSYTIRVECRFSDDLHANFNRLILYINSALHDAMSYPQISAYVGWLVDEANDGSWGVDMVLKLALGPEIGTGTLESLEKSLPQLYEAFKAEIVRKSVE